MKTGMVQRGHKQLAGRDGTGQRVPVPPRTRAYHTLLPVHEEDWRLSSPHHIRFHSLEHRVHALGLHHHNPYGRPRRVGLHRSCRNHATSRPPGVRQMDALEQRSYTTFSRQPSLPHQPSQPIRGEFALHHHGRYGASAFVPYDRSTDDIYHFRVAGPPPRSLSTAPTLADVILVRQSGAPPLTGNYMVNMLPREDPLSDTALFVSDGCQTILLSGSTDLDPGDLLSTSTSALV